MKKKSNILIIGFGSIGKRHYKNCQDMGFDTYVKTNYPENDTHFSCYEELKHKIDLVIIASPTQRHLKDIIEAFDNTGCRNFLIEKPLADNFENAIKIQEYIISNKINAKVAYNMRFLNELIHLKENIDSISEKIRLVQITAGTYLPNWRTGVDYRNSYSSKRDMGGGVHLDLSHEIDYMLMLFGKPENQIVSIHKRVSSLDIDSVDYYKSIFEYNRFVVDLGLDYFRKGTRKIEIFGENNDIAKLDFFKGEYYFLNENYKFNFLEEIKKSYQNEIIDFLENDGKNLTSVEDAVYINKLIEEKNV
jgi:predicted dehydrogenase